MLLRPHSLPELPSARDALPADMPFFFAGPTRTLIAHDEGRTLRGRLRDRERLLDDAERLLRDDSSSRVIVGAVPFANDAEVRLFSPTRVVRSGRWWVDGSAGRAPRRLARAQPEDSRATSAADELFKRSVRAAVEAIGRGELRKVVLARMKEVPLERAPDLRRLLVDLRTQNTHGFIFALAVPGESVAERRTLVGASPELLVSRRGERVLSAPLAGSTPRARDPLEDLRRAEALLRSPKDRHEHAIVVEQVVESMRPFMRELRCEPEPSLVLTPTLHHLATRVEGTLRDRDISSLRVALALHPTPAVCGAPAPEAARFIEHVEPFDRGYFTGALGHMDASGDGDWIVTIRCAELTQSHVRVFAGAGIVGSSQPDSELLETEVKMQTMLDALGLGGRL